MGQKRTLEDFQAMSALPPKADIGTGPRIAFDAATPAAWRYSPRLAAPHLSRATWPPKPARLVLEVDVSELLQVDHDAFTVDDAGREMKNPGGIARRGLQSEFCSQISVPTS